MKLGCSLCGWNNLEYYKNYNNLESLLASINTAVDLSYYELPFLFHDKDHQNKILQYANSVFSVHASKTVFNKDQQYISSYFKEINEYCSFLNCKVVVVHPPEKKSINKIELAINRMTNSIIAIENVDNSSYEIYLHYPKQCKMVIDVAHAVYCEQDNFYTSLPSNAISHFHIRGYSKTVKYLKISENKCQNIIKIIKTFSTSDEYPFILEYPYKSINELIQDLFCLKNIIQGQN